VSKREKSSENGYSKNAGRKKAHEKRTSQMTSENQQNRGVLKRNVYDDQSDQPINQRFATLQAAPLERHEQIVACKVLTCWKITTQTNRINRIKAPGYEPTAAKRSSIIGNQNRMRIAATQAPISNA
jgi:hypothetical protein